MRAYSQRRKVRGRETGSKRMGRDCPAMDQDPLMESILRAIRDAYARDDQSHAGEPERVPEPSSPPKAHEKAGRAISKLINALSGILF
jgi:hypothetical protein